MKKSNFGKFGIVVAFFAAFLMIAISGCEQKAPKNSRVAQAEKGKVHFQKYCSSCHGEDAKGIVIDSLNTQPADLTKIMSSRRLERFPILTIANIIDGRKMAKSHGSRTMPIWGEVFSDKEHLDEKEIKGKLGEVIAYLMFIQE